MRRLVWIILSVHAVLLVWSIPDYFPSVDHAYHVALARQYGEHGSFYWDSIHYAPEGRPNLQGPLLHYAIGGLGRLLGGSGNAYVVALAIFGFAQWAAAMWTAYFFGRRYSGDVGALIAAVLLAGSAFASFPFSIGLPSGWTFILAPWAIHFFLEGRTALTVLCLSAAIYVHLAGIAMVPVGVLIAAVLTRQWRRLIITGLVTFVVAAPYIAHFLLHRAWYRGERGHVAMTIAPLIYILAAPALAGILRRPRQYAFLIAWSAAPLAWLVQDPTRFVAQSTIAGAVLGGVFIAWVWERTGPRLRTALVTALVAMATLYPLSIPSLAVELLWDVKPGSLLRQLDWKAMRAVADAIERDGLNSRMVSVYNTSLGSAIAVYTPVRQLYGHWVEVQPPKYSANRVPAGELVHVLPLAPDDARLQDLTRRGWVRVHGGARTTTVVTLERRPTVPETSALLMTTLSEDCAWLSRNAVNNTMPSTAKLFSSTAQRERRQKLDAQRARVGAVQLALLLHAYTLEPVDAQVSRQVRGYANAFGSMANFLSDDSAVGMMSDARHELLRKNLTRVAEQSRCLTMLMCQELQKALSKLSRDYFWAA